jgi:hypothetical protein
MSQVLRKIGILTLGLCALASVLYIILSIAVPYWFKSQYQAKNPHAPAKILVVWYRGIGEQETIERLKIVGKRLGLELHAVSTKPKFYIRWFVKDPVATARNELKPDFLLSIQDWVMHYPGLPNYMTLTLGTERYLSADENGAMKFTNPEHEKFEALLPSFKDIDQLQAAYERNGKKYQGFAWYPTSYVTYYPIATPNKLFYSGGFLWDKTRGSQKYKELFVKLDQAKYFAVSGPKKKWRHTPNSALGFIPINGVSLLEAQHKAGISLLLHTQLHLNGGAPTGRIFEAAAAKTVIISDKHPFIEKYFGDNVFYVDITQDAEAMFQQIDGYMQWIYANPEQAQTMAENCNRIFTQQFSMEAQLQRLIDLHHSLHA